MDSAIVTILMWSGIAIAVFLLCTVYNKCSNLLEQCCDNTHTNRIHSNITIIQRKTIEQKPPKIIKMTKVIPQTLEKQTCSICLEPLNNDIVQCCSCGHCFHAKCIQKWLKKHDTCPNCRQSCENLLQKTLFQ